MVVADGLVPVWHPGRRQQPWWQLPSCKGLIVVIIIRRLCCFRKKLRLCYAISLTITSEFYSHLVKPCLIHVESASSWFGGLGLASGCLHTSGLDFKFSLRNELTQNTAECRVINLAQPGILPPYICKYSDSYFCFPYSLQCKIMVNIVYIFAIMSVFDTYLWYGVNITKAQIFPDCPVIVRCLEARGFLESLKCVKYSYKIWGLFVIVVL